tara:strand:- start:1025 stop:1561 length:537 start_codon:yes stop_codon:yes gene_type:complete
MNSRQNTIWVLLILFSLASIVAAGMKLLPANKAWAKAKDRAKNVQFGTDKELERVIEYLEIRIKDRDDYQFILEEQPMRLTNVLYLTDSQGRSLRYRNRGKLRVTHIIDGIQKYAGINYKDKNYTVVIGDSIAGGKVIWIDPTEIIITKKDKEFHYPVAGLEIEDDRSGNGNERRREN